MLADVDAVATQCIVMQCKYLSRFIFVGLHFAVAASGVPHGYHIEALHGFVEELVVNDDPEYQWIDKIRSMRASNEARQIQFSKLSGNSLVNSVACNSST